MFSAAVLMLHLFWPILSDIISLQQSVDELKSYIVYPPLAAIGKQENKGFFSKLSKQKDLVSGSLRSSIWTWCWPQADFVFVFVQDRYVIFTKLPSYQSGHCSQSQDPSKTLWIGNIPKDANWRDLQVLARKAGDFWMIFVSRRRWKANLARLVRAAGWRFSMARAKAQVPSCLDLRRLRSRLKGFQSWFWVELSKLLCLKDLKRYV